MCLSLQNLNSLIALFPWICQSLVLYPPATVGGWQRTALGYRLVAMLPKTGFKEYITKTRKLQITTFLPNILSDPYFPANILRMYCKSAYPNAESGSAEGLKVDILMGVMGVWNGLRSRIAIGGSSV